MKAIKYNITSTHKLSRKILVLVTQSSGIATPNVLSADTSGSGMLLVVVFMRLKSHEN